MKETELGINPFTITLLIRVKEIVRLDLTEEARELLKINNIKPEDITNNRIQLEQDKRVQVYTSKPIRMLLAKLSPAGRSLFLWIQQTIDYNDQSIRLDKKRKARYMNEFAVSKNTCIKAIRELRATTVLIQSADAKEYWINPQVFFKGNRTKVFPDNVSVNGGVTGNELKRNVK